MGCVCAKGSSINEYDEKHSRDKDLNRKSSKRLAASSRREGVAVESYGGNNDATTRLIPTQSAEDNAAFTPLSWDKGQKKSMATDSSTRSTVQQPPTMEVGMNAGRSQTTRIVSMGNGVEAAQAAAGWPSWLTAVAAEAINGWVPRKADSFERLDKVSFCMYTIVYLPGFLIPLCFEIFRQRKCQ